MSCTNVNIHNAGSQGCTQLHQILFGLFCFHAVSGNLVDTGRLIDALCQTENNSSSVKISLLIVTN